MSRVSTSWHSWRISVEQEIARLFERDGMHPVPARYVADRVVREGERPLREMRDEELSPRQAASVLYEEWID